jgi:hypothetical protein
MFSALFCSHLDPLYVLDTVCGIPLRGSVLTSRIYVQVVRYDSGIPRVANTREVLANIMNATDSARNKSLLFDVISCMDRYVS